MARTSPSRPLSGDPSPDRSAEASLGELVATATRDLSSLLRQEVQLAKVEITRDVVAAGKAGGLFGGAGVTGLFALQFLSVAAAFGLAALDLPLGVAFAIVGALYLLGAAALALSGRRSLSRVGPPDKTIETVRDDLAWARHPTAPGGRGATAARVDATAGASAD